MLLSVVVPLYNESGNIAPLVAEIRAALSQIQHEIVLVDDGSTDGTLAETRGLLHVRVLSHARSCGQSAALQTGIRAAQGEWIVTLDGDGQNNPADIPALWEKVAMFDSHQQRVMVMGERVKRQDNRVRRLTSRLANAVREALLHDGVRDTGCSLKIFRRDDFMALPYFDHIHRYIPALMRREGIATHAYPVDHRPRQRGISKYGFWDRLWVGIADLMGTWWLLQRRRLPQIQEHTHVG